MTVKVTSRNYVGETLTFNVFEDVKVDNHTDNYSLYDTWDDERMPADPITIAIDEEGKGEASFYIPSEWENDHEESKEKDTEEEFPRAYYVKNPNKTEEENKQSAKRILPLMLKVAKDDIRSGYEAIENAAVIGEELKLEEKENTKAGICPKCLKKHIDIADESKWQTQFDTRYGNKSKQNTACWKACITVLTNYGLKNGSGFPAGAIQTVSEENKTVVIKNVKLGNIYLNNQLERGNPVLVGVRYAYKKKELNFDKTTDHFIVIVGRGCEEGNIFYRYFEVGTYLVNKTKNGVNPNNRLYLKDDGTIVGNSPQGTKEYTISQVRKNK